MASASEAVTGLSIKTIFPALSTGCLFQVNAPVVGFKQYYIYLLQQVINTFHNFYSHTLYFFYIVRYPFYGRFDIRTAFRICRRYPVTIVYRRGGFEFNTFVNSTLCEVSSR